MSVVFRIVNMIGVDIAVVAAVVVAAFVLDT